MTTRTPPDARLRGTGRTLAGLVGDHAGTALLLGWVVLAIAGNIGQWGGDMAALWFAGHFLAAGQPDLVYAAPPGFFGGTPPAWQPLLDAELRGRPAAVVYSYAYPPVWAGLMAPISRELSAQRFLDLAMVANVLMLAGCVLLAERIARPRILSRSAFRCWGVAVLAITLPAQIALAYNQPNILISFLTLACFALLDRHPRLAGGLLGLAAAIKLLPIALCLLFLPRRRFGALAACLATVTALAALSVAWLGWPLHRAFLDQLALASENMVWGYMNPAPRIAVQDLLAHFGLAETFHFDQAWLAFGHPSAPVKAGAEIAALAGTLATALVWRARGAGGQTEMTLGLLALSIGIFLLGPLSWLHYMIVPMLIAPAILARMAPLPATAVLLGAIALDTPAATQLLSLRTFTWVQSAFWTGLCALAVALLLRRDPPRERKPGE